MLLTESNVAGVFMSSTIFLSSCPGLSRASTNFYSRASSYHQLIVRCDSCERAEGRRVDGRDSAPRQARGRPGHDGYGSTLYALGLLQSRGVMPFSCAYLSADSL